MDLAELQRNLEILESRYSELVAQGDVRVQGLEAELADRKSQCEASAERIQALVAETQAAVETQAQLQVELTQLRSELAARDQEHAELLCRSQELEATASQAQAECNRLGEQLVSQGEVWRQSEERLQSIHHVQSELLESRQQTAQLRQVLQEQQANEQAWRASVEAELSELRDQGARYQEEVDAHLGSLRELELLRTECARRDQALRLSEEQATTIRQLERRCLELEETLIQLQCKEQEYDPSLPVAPPQSTGRLQQLEQELKKARDEAELLLERLFLVQEEFEYYYPLPQEQGLAERQPSPPLHVPPASRTSLRSAAIEAACSRPVRTLTVHSLPSIIRAMAGGRIRSTLQRWFSNPLPVAVAATTATGNGLPEAILVRILGCDRPPQIAAGTTLEHLRFVLEHEPPHPGLEKRWLLNRIVEPAQRQALIDLLEQHRQPWEELPFEPQAYAACWSDVGALPDDCHPWGSRFDRLEAAEQAQVLDYIACDKHLYLLNRNGARNHAIQSALAEAPWVFPWDGAFFLTAAAWAALRPLLQVPDLAYLAVPTAEAVDADSLLRSDDHPPHARLPPQLGFSRHARVHYNPQLREGARIDQAMLQRLALPGPWLDPEHAQPTCPWEGADLTPAPDAARLVQAGWVFQLPGAAVSGGDQPIELWIDAIRMLTRRTDMGQIGAALARVPLRCWTSLIHSPRGLSGLASIAANARAVPPQSVTDKPETLPGTAERSYVNAVPHWQGLAGSESALSRAALLDQPAPLCGDVSQHYDRARWQLMADCVCALSLDGSLNANQASIAHAHRLVRSWFLDPATAMIPDGAFARLSAVDPGRNVLDACVDFRDLYPLLDALTLLRQAGCFSLAEQQQLDDWLDAFLAWLSEDSAAFLRDHCASSAATWYHLLMLAIAAYRGRRNVSAQVFDNLPGLLDRQFRPDGSPRSAAAGTPLRHDQLFNLQAWVNLCVLSSSLGRDLLAFTDSNGIGLQRAFQYALRHLPGEEAGALPARTWLAAMQAQLQADVALAPAPELPPLAEASSGLPPFWTLCRAVSLGDASGPDI